MVVSKLNLKKKYYEKQLLIFVKTLLLIFLVGCYIYNGM
jgi:hypothetical protein